ncbi:hypothetical protein L211DRAFT_251772 [Terfezia boudieri ATCC MYA-4762]|uniref:Uncharacterized protein n=1 Tax=Terfezia boudieri ATCC MYA-4762 TaxID=1051890 RepID=A0A3N4M8B1_9PEZI|nr:hypothetical protein L211DRAFT_251772 [Terfezia boudieri ATCC MYA-4762]
MTRLPIPTVQSHSNHGDIELGRQKFCRLSRYNFFCFFFFFFFFFFPLLRTFIYTKDLLHTSKMRDCAVIVLAAIFVVGVFLPTAFIITFIYIKDLLHTSRMRDCTVIVLAAIFVVGVFLPTAFFHFSSSCIS